MVKGVTFGESRVAEISRTSVDDMRDTRIALDSIIDVLERTVGYILGNLEEDFRHVDASRRTRNLDKIRNALGYSSREDMYQAVWEYLTSNQGMTVAEFIKRHIDHRGSAMEYVSCIMLLRIALDSWVKYNHCTNQCSSVHRYERKHDTIHVQLRTHVPLRKLCNDKHDAIMGLLGIDDIRLFDEMVSEVSAGKCSIVFPKDKRSQRFFFFGCWNRDNCEAKDYRAAVLGSLKKAHRKSGFDFGLIAGDHIYPHVDHSKSKTYWQTTVDYAFNLLADVGVNEIYATVGNHDVKKESILMAQLKNDNDTMYMHKNAYSVRPCRYLKIICIDTNLLGASIPKFYTTSKEELIRDFVVVPSGVAMLDWLQVELDRPTPENVWTIVVGHDPLVTVRVNKIVHMNHAFDLIKMISSKKRCMYMCADTHNFQAWRIRYGGNSFPMIVSGTGGAKPDAALTRLGNYTTEVNMKNTMFHLIASHAPYGYCDIACSKSRFIIDYKPLPGCGQAEKEEVIHLEFNVETNVFMSSLDPIPEPHASCAAIDTTDKVCKNPNGELKGGAMGGAGWGFVLAAISRCLKPLIYAELQKITDELTNSIKNKNKNKYKSFQSATLTSLLTREHVATLIKVLLLLPEKLSDVKNFVNGSITIPTDDRKWYINRIWYLEMLAMYTRCMYLRRLHANNPQFIQKTSADTCEDYSRIDALLTQRITCADPSVCTAMSNDCICFIDDLMDCIRSVLNEEDGAMYTSIQKLSQQVNMPLPNDVKQWYQLDPSQLLDQFLQTNTGSCFAVVTRNQLSQYGSSKNRKRTPRESPTSEYRI